MNSTRILRLPRLINTNVALRNLRPSLRNHSTGTQTNTSAPSSPWTRRFIYVGIFGGLGIALGKQLEQMLATPPAPGSPEDEKEIKRLEWAYEVGLPIVHRLRENPDYVESGVYEYFSDDQKSHRLTSGPLAGSRGLGLQVRWPSLIAASRTAAYGAPFAC